MDDPFVRICAALAAALEEARKDAGWLARNGTQFCPDCGRKILLGPVHLRSVLDETTRLVEGGRPFARRQET